VSESWYRIEFANGGTPPNCGGQWTELTKDQTGLLAEEAAAKTDEAVLVVTYTRTVVAAYRRTVDITVTRTEGGADAPEEEAQGR
jgi:hypothetical protein